MSIDYERLRKVWPRQKAALNRAMKERGAEERIAAVKDAVIKAADEWDEIGAWPDDWSMFQRALDDVLPWNQQISIDELRLQAARA